MYIFFFIFLYYNLGIGVNLVSSSPTPANFVQHFYSGFLQVAKSQLFDIFGYCKEVRKLAYKNCTRLVGSRSMFLMLSCYVGCFRNLLKSMKVDYKWSMPCPDG